jgi:digeranylgeranylglycerophospholipid reductase
MATKRFDVVVVGAGPAGATTARFAAQAGLRVLLVDKKGELGTPVQCSGAVSANALNECGVPADAEFIIEPVFGFLIYSDSGQQVRIDHRQAGHDEALGYVVDRKRFDRYLARMAMAAGAELWLKARVVGLDRDSRGARLQIERFGQRQTVAARVVVGADGLMSQVGLMAGLRVAVPIRDLASCLQYIVEGVETDGLLEVVTGRRHAPGGYAWVFPKGPGMAEVGLGVTRTLTQRDARWHLDRFMRQSFMCQRFHGARIVEVQGGGVPLAAASRHMVSDNLILVGDAARQVNPITGGGIHTALRGGRIAGEYLGQAAARRGRLTRDRLVGYQERWHAELGSALDELYKMKTTIFSQRDAARQDRALFETLGSYFMPDSKFKRV